MFLQLKQFDYDIVHVSGKNVPVADVPSRAVGGGSQAQFEKELETVCMTVDSDLVLEEIKLQTALDEDLTTLMGIVKAGWPEQKGEVNNHQTNLMRL